MASVEIISCSYSRANADVTMHKGTIQITVAERRNGRLSGFTLIEAESWSKVDTSSSRRIFVEATSPLPPLRFLPARSSHGFLS